MAPIETIKIHKFLADVGLGSRRELERWVADGRVTVNGVRAKVGDRVTQNDIVRVDGRKIGSTQSRNRPNTRVLLYHKPVGEVCARKDDRYPTVFDQLPTLRSGRWVGVGRLDLNTSGLMLFTNRGELANRLMHPSSEVEREYAVRIHGTVTAGMLKKLRKGVELEDGQASFQSISKRGGTGTNQWFHVVLCEGRNREVRRLWESQGVQVSRLTRVRYGIVALPRGLKAGQWKELNKLDIQSLAQSVELEIEK